MATPPHGLCAGLGTVAVFFLVARLLPWKKATLIAEGVTSKDTEKRITKALQQKGYATGRDPDPGVKSTGHNVLYYMPGMQEQAISISRTLAFGGHLKDLRIEESKVPITGNWLLLVLGGEK